MPLVHTNFNNSSSNNNNNNEFSRFPTGASAPLCDRRDTAACASDEPPFRGKDIAACVNGKLSVARKLKPDALPTGSAKQLAKQEDMSVMPGFHPLAQADAEHGQDAWASSARKGRAK